MNKNKKLKVSIRQDFTDKASKNELSLTGRGWSNVELSIDEFLGAHQKRGTRSPINFFGSCQASCRLRLSNQAAF
jgi:hypothetical protein